MRKIETKKDKDKKTRRNQIIVGGVLIFIMFFSVLGYGFGGRTSNNGSSDSNTNSYNGYNFEKVNGFWRTEFGNGYLFFIYSPSEVLNLDIPPLSLDKYSNKTVYLYSENPDAEAEIYYNLNQIGSNVVKSCYGNCSGNLPVMTCQDNLVVVRESENESIRNEQNCVFIEGPSSDLILLSDEFMFRLFGMI